MLTIFNRQELIITTNMNRQADIRIILSQNEIEYTVKTTNLQSPTAIGSCRGKMVNPLNKCQSTSKIK